MNTLVETFFEPRVVNQIKKVKVVVMKMTKEQARQAYPYRPYSKYAESRFGGDTFYDDTCLMLNGVASRCSMCQAPTKNKYLTDGTCPDCDGRSEANGTDPTL